VCSIATWRSILIKLFFKVRSQKEDTVSSTKDCGDRPLLPSKCLKFSQKVLLGISSANVLQWKHLDIPILSCF
jgi:hypothetical protein